MWSLVSWEHVQCWCLESRCPCLLCDHRVPPGVDGRGPYLKAVSSSVSFSQEESLVSLTALAFHKHKEKFLSDISASSNGVAIHPLMQSRKHILLQPFCFLVPSFQSITKYCQFHFINCPWICHFLFYTPPLYEVRSSHLLSLALLQPYLLGPSLSLKQSWPCCQWSF